MKVRCLNCGYEFDGEIFEDELGAFSNCPKCESSFDVDVNELNMEENKMERTPKYNVGDTVIYLDLAKDCNVATITKVEETDVHEWNKDKEVKFLYSLKEFPYLRYEEEIVGLYNY